MKKNLKITYLLILICVVGKAQNYTFNTKGTFRITSKTEGSVTSYFYLNTKTGLLGQDTQALQAMAKENIEGEVFSVIEYEKRIKQYVKVDGKKYVIEMPLAKENYTAKKFWKDFKKTGKQQTFGKYPAREYTGIAEGRQISVWLGEKNYNLDGKLQGDILGLYGVGYLYNPSEKTFYLLVHFQDPAEEVEITLLDIVPFSKTFNLQGYQAMKMPAIPNNPSTDEKPSPENPTENYYSNPSQAYGTQNAKCALYYEQAIMVIEQSLPSLKDALKNEQISVEQKTELRKQIACMEKKLPILKKMLSEAKAVDSRFKGNEQKLMEECQKIGDKYNDTLDKMCE